ncbi:MAG: glycosyltransferase, partial [Alphaproteobacteria bacterium]|nr:glycosyltransferase [Alphaproteobacteria bacterium]
MNAPSISVCMPVYNVAPFIDAAIASIRNQSFSDFEFIVVDDGSTDAT